MRQSSCAFMEVGELHLPSHSPFNFCINLFFFFHWKQPSWRHLFVMRRWYLWPGRSICTCHFPQEPLLFHIKEAVDSGVLHLHMKASLIHSDNQGGFLYCFLLLPVHFYLCLLWLLYCAVDTTNRFYHVSREKKNKSCQLQEMAWGYSTLLFSFHSVLTKGISCSPAAWTETVSLAVETDLG